MLHLRPHARLAVRVLVSVGEDVHERVGLGLEGCGSCKTWGPIDNVDVELSVV